MPTSTTKSVKQKVFVKKGGRKSPLAKAVSETKATAPKRTRAFDPELDKLLAQYLKILDDAKATDIVTLDVRGKTSIADYMLVASGGSNTHVRAIANRLLEFTHKNKIRTQIEGLDACDWVLLDCGDVIIHIFRPEVRDFYKLEDVWTGPRPVG